MENGKGVFAVVIIAFAILGGLLFLPGSAVDNNALHADDFLRIHIRANSNSSADQQVKLKVKDEVVSVLAPLFAEADTKQKAMEIMDNNLALVTETANRVLAQNGFGYTSSASITSEQFPTRNYADLTLEGDIYDALIINLGAAAGDNWWCIAYPPMCFVNIADSSGEGVVYKSQLAEIIKKFFNKG